MASLEIEHTFVEGTPAEADEVNTNFQQIRDFLNNAIVHRDGAKEMSGRLLLPALDPQTSNEAARKAYVDATKAAAITDARKGRFKYGGSTGTSPLWGSMPNVNSELVQCAGYNSGVTSAGGNIQVNLPAGAFANGILSVQITPINMVHSEMDSARIVRSVDSTRFIVTYTNPETKAVRGGITASFTWVVVGW